VNHIASSFFYYLRWLPQIRCAVGPEVIKILVTSFILGRLAYCDAVLTDLPYTTIRLLQRAQNAAAHLIAGSLHQDSVTPIVKQLHCIPVNLRVTYKLCLSVIFLSSLYDVLTIYGILYC